MNVDWLAYYFLAIPILVIVFVPGNRAPRWLFFGVFAMAIAGVYLMLRLFTRGYL